MLCREILLHADGSDDTMFSVDGLLELVNHVRRIDQGISERIVTSGESAMSALRIGHSGCRDITGRLRGASEASQFLTNKSRPRLNELARGPALQAVVVCLADARSVGRPLFFT